MNYKYQLQGKDGLTTTYYTNLVEPVDIHIKCIDILSQYLTHKEGSVQRSALRLLESVARNPGRDTVTMVKSTSDFVEYVTGEELVLMQFVIDGSGIRSATVLFY